MAALPSRQSFEDPLDRSQIEETPDLRLVNSVRQLPLGQDLREVDKRAGEARDGNVVDEASVFFVDEARAVQHEAPPHLARARPCDLDRRAAAHDPPELCGGAVTCKRPLATRVNGSNEVGLARHGGVAYRVDAVVPGHQPTGLHTPPDCLPRQPRLPRLSPCHDPVLPAR